MSSEEYAFQEPWGAQVILHWRGTVTGCRRKEAITQKNSRLTISSLGLTKLLKAWNIWLPEMCDFLTPTSFFTFGEKLNSTVPSYSMTSCKGIMCVRDWTKKAITVQSITELWYKLTIWWLQDFNILKRCKAQDVRDEPFRMSNMQLNMNFQFP